MKAIIRRARAAIIVASLWAGILGVVTLGVGLVDALLQSSPMIGGGSTASHRHLGTYVLAPAARGAVAGALAGLVFSLLLARFERGEHPVTLARSRILRWGLVAGVLVGTTWLISRGLAEADSAQLAFGDLGSALALAGASICCAFITEGIVKRQLRGRDSQPDLNREHGPTGHPSTVEAAPSLASHDSANDRQRA